MTGWLPPITFFPQSDALHPPFLPCRRKSMIPASTITKCTIAGSACARPTGGSEFDGLCRIGLVPACPLESTRAEPEPLCDIGAGLGGRVGIVDADGAQNRIPNQSGAQ